MKNKWIGGGSSRKTNVLFICLFDKKINHLKKGD